MIFQSQRSWWIALFLTILVSLCLNGFPDAQAQSERIELTFDIYGEVTYDTIWNEAEDLARQAIHETFDQNANISEVVLVITANRNGRILPLLSLTVPRTAWQNQSNLAQWIVWAAPSFSSETLLALDVEIPDNPPPATRRPAPGEPRGSLDLIENDPAFRDD